MTKSLIISWRVFRNIVIIVTTDGVFYIPPIIPPKILPLKLQNSRRTLQNPPIQPGS